MGRPVQDDRHLFEMLTLEGAQAGLSWITILKRREGYRRVFEGVRCGADRPLWEEGRGAADGGRRDHPQPRQDRVHDQERPGYPRPELFPPAEGRYRRSARMSIVLPSF
jgi:hypothetical protein